MTYRARLPLEPELAALKAEIRLTALRLRNVSRSLRREQTARPHLRLVRGGLWPRSR